MIGNPRTHHSEMQSKRLKMSILPPPDSVGVYTAAPLYVLSGGRGEKKVIFRDSELSFCNRHTAVFPERTGKAAVCLFVYRELTL